MVINIGIASEGHAMRVFFIINSYFFNEVNVNSLRAFLLNTLTASQVLNACCIDIYRGTCAKHLVGTIFTLKIEQKLSQ